MWMRGWKGIGNCRILKPPRISPRPRNYRMKSGTRRLPLAGWRAQPAATMLLLPALNQMFDITTTRTMTTQMHPPKIIFAMLFVLTLASSLLAGYGMAGGKSRNWITGGFALIMAFAIYVILYLEYPRIGLIRVDAFDQVIMDVRRGWK